MDSEEIKRKRRSKAEIEGRNHKCQCGKGYFSFQALCIHIRNKHSDMIEGFPKKKRGRPKIGRDRERDTSSPDIFPVRVSSSARRRGRETCDDIFMEYLRKKENKVTDERFFEIKDCIYSLRECINRNSEKVDIDDFLWYDFYTQTEKPDLIPNIIEFYIADYLPKEHPNFAQQSQVTILFDFCKWLKQKNYTQMEVPTHLSPRF